MTFKKNNNTDYFNQQEQKLFGKLSTPQKVQDFIDSLAINFEEKGETCKSPLFVLKTGSAHCMEGAMLAAAILEIHGHKPLVLDLRSIKPHDDDHVVAVFKQYGCFGAISKTNHAVLRYREPVYKTIRELVLSYFHEYFLDNGKKTLREYSLPFNLNHFNYLDWRTSQKDLFEIPSYLDKIKHYTILNSQQIKHLRKTSALEIKAGKLVEYKLRS